MNLKKILCVSFILLIDIILLILISIKIYNIDYNKEIIYSTREYNIETEITIYKEKIDTTYIIIRKKIKL